MVAKKVIRADVAGIVNHALWHYDQFVDNGVLSVLNLGYFNDDLLQNLGVQRVTKECRDAVVKAFTFMGIPAVFVGHHGLRLTIDQKNLPANWRSLVRPI